MLNTVFNRGLRTELPSDFKNAFSKKKYVSVSVAELERFDWNIIAVLNSDFFIMLFFRKLQTGLTYIKKTELAANNIMLERKVNQLKSK